MTNKDLLYCTENSVQYTIMTDMGKESEKEWIYVYVFPLVFPVVVYGCNSWTIKKAEPRRLDPFEL